MLLYPLSKYLKFDPASTPILGSDDEDGVGCGWDATAPSGGAWCEVLPGEAQFLTVGLVESGDWNLVKFVGCGLFSIWSQEETKHFFRLTNCLIVEMR